MENASKALMIAGGILIALIILGMLMMMFNRIRELPQSQDAIAEVEQITKFNREYLAYEKEKMYGTDIITLIAKAMNNNYTNLEKQLYTDGEFDIDIKVTIVKDDIIRYAIEHRYYNGHMSTETYKKEGAELKYTDSKGKSKSITLKSILEKDKEYSIITDIDKWEELLGEEESIKLAEYEVTGVRRTSDSSSVKREHDSGHELDYLVYYSGKTDFKRSYFRCTGVEYDEDTGRVISMSFEQLSAEEE